jgi:hypothetical protein
MHFSRRKADRIVDHVVQDVSISKYFDDPMLLEIARREAEAEMRN